MTTPVQNSRFSLLELRVSPTASSTKPGEIFASHHWRFSPSSNRYREKISAAEELRVLVATDILSEGQNLQDAAIVVNYTLPCRGELPMLRQPSQGLYLNTAGGLLVTLP